MVNDIEDKDLIIKKAKAIGLGDITMPAREVRIHSVDDCGYKYMDVYCIAEDMNTKEEFKIKVRIEGSQTMTVYFLTDEEFEKAST